VAGRNPMFELSSHQILKPLNTREAEFYQRFPRSLKERKLTCHIDGVDEESTRIEL